MHNKKILLRTSRGEDQVTYKIRHNRTTTDFLIDAERQMRMDGCSTSSEKSDASSNYFI